MPCDGLRLLPLYLTARTAPCLQSKILSRLLGILHELSMIKPASLKNHNKIKGIQSCSLLKAGRSDPHAAALNVVQETIKGVLRYCLGHVNKFIKINFPLSLKTITSMT